jgi:tetratricopeptide (TPR) repeat protein
MRFLRKLLGLSPSARDCYEQALAREQTADHDQAIAALNEAVRLDSQDADAYYVRALVLEILGDYDRALTDLNAVLELKPTSIDCIAVQGAQVHQGKRVVRTGPRCSEPDIVERVVQESVATDRARLYFERGLTCQGQGELDRAIADFGEAIRLRPEPQSYYARGRAYFLAARYQEAIADLTCAQAFNPPVVQQMLGDSYKETGDYDRAVAALSEAIRLDRTNADNYIARGFAYQFKAKPDKAIADHSAAIRLDPESVVAHEARAEAYLTAGQTELAERDQYSAQQLRGDNESAARHSIVPSAQRVAARALVLAAIVYRESLEWDPDAEPYRRKLLDWIDALDLGAELERGERSFLHTPIGHAARQIVINALWRSEGLGVLAWALHRLEAVPRYDELMNVGPVVASLGFTEKHLSDGDTAAVQEVLQSAGLRPLSQIRQFSSHITIVNWRLRQFRFDRASAAYVGTFDVRGDRPVAVEDNATREQDQGSGIGEGMDFAAYLRQYPNFQESWLDGLRLLDGDLAIGKEAIAHASPDAVKQCMSMAVERQIAAYWLEGDNRTYSKVNPSTFLSAILPPADLTRGSP